MNIDRTTIVVRERRLPELYDLALLVLRRYGFPLMALGIIGAAPWCALNYWLLYNPVRQAPFGSYYLLLLLMLVQTPFATAGITAYLGSVLFEGKPSIWSSWWQGVRATWVLIPFALWRGVLGLFPILLLFMPAHAVEVAVLERQKFLPSWRRSSALRSVWSGELVLHLMVSLAVICFALFIVIDTTEVIQSTLFHAQVMTNDPDAWSKYMPCYALLPHIAIWLAVIMLAVVRFLSYIDLRTRREGWEIDLALRHQAKRLGGGV